MNANQLQMRWQAHKRLAEEFNREEAQDVAAIRKALEEGAEERALAEGRPIPCRPIRFAA